jgi:lactate dehydrogenase-like 2-hydroxyacid dehydrogenase
MSGPRVRVTRRWPEVVESELRKTYDVTLSADDRPMSAEQLQDALRQYDAVLPTVTDQITAQVLQAEPLRCRFLGNFGVGFNHIDLDAARTRGITVTNTPDVLTDCTADIAMLLLLAAARRGGEGERHVRAGQWTGWRPTHMLGTKVTGKTLGLIGFGRIAQAMAHKAHHGFDMQIMFYDPFPPPREKIERVKARQCGSVEEVLRESDFVAIHVPGSRENYHLVNAARLALMKPSAYLINTARGDIVDAAALVAALRAGKIRGAGLDVYEGEPGIPAGLAELDNVVLLPHLGSASSETRIAMGMRVLENLAAFLAGKRPRDTVS